MEKSPSWKADGFLAILYIPCTLWNKHVYYCDKTGSFFFVLSQMNPVHDL